MRGTTVAMRRLALTGLAAVAAAGVVATIELAATRPAPSVALQDWRAATPAGAPDGAALFAFADFGGIDLDTLETSAMPWAPLAAALALEANGGAAESVDMEQARAAFRRYGFLYPRRIDGEPGLTPSPDVPLGYGLGAIERSWPPIRLSAINIGCAACHAGPAYGRDGAPDPATAVLGAPNSGLDLEGFTTHVYRALKRGFADEPALRAAMRRLFPDMSWRERLTLDWIVLPRARARIAALQASFDRPLPFPNGAPGLTNGVAALKSRLGLLAHDRFVEGAGFVSIPDLADRGFRSAFLADGAYAPKGAPRWRPIGREEASARDPAPVAAVASFFMVPSMGLSPERTEAAIAALTNVVAWLGARRPPRFPGPTDLAKAAQGRAVYARDCARCHGVYDASLDAPALLSFPNWAGSVGADMSRAEAFDERLRAAVDATGHGRRIMDVAATGKTAAPPLAGLWSSAPYFVNGSVPTLRHVLEPATRPARFMTGGHRLNLELVGVDGALDPTGAWVYPPGYTPYSAPVMIDASKPGFSNRGHEAEVSGLTREERDALLEYLKLL